MRILLSITFLLVINNAFAQKYESYKKLKDTTFQSSSLGYGKDISIVVPLEWEASIDKKFPVILIFDKQNERSNNYIINTIDYITTNYQMPSCIVISVASTFEYRYKETSYKISTPSGKAKENEQFIFDELLPFAEEELKANAFRLLIGHSRYGYYTSSLFVNRIHDLNAVIALCPFYEQEQVNFADSSIHYKPKNDQPVKYYRAGVESLYMEDYYRLENQVNKNNINIKATEFKHADHNVIPGLAIAPALYDVFHYWAKEQNRYYKNTVFNAKELELIAENTQAHYGEGLRLSIGVLNGVGWGFFGRKEYKSAIQAWELLLKEYPSFADAYWGIIESQKELKIDKQETIRAFKKCLADYDYYTPEEKIEMLKELE
jgi:enterochelin esterase-like enzyme